MKKIPTAILAFLAMLILILDSKTALSGGIEGVQICLMTVIPSLLPFFVLSILLTGALSGMPMKILRPLGHFCKMPLGSEPLLLLGLLGGYPSGAQSVAQTYRTGQLSRQDAHRLLGFCNNAGPSFLFGMAALAFPESWMPWALWLIHILSAILTGHFLPGTPGSATVLPSRPQISLIQALETALGILARVCGFIILFRILLAFFDRWFLWFLHSDIRVLLTGILELANGCLQLAKIPSLPLRFCICSAILSLGGICVTMQTLSVTGSLGLGLYLPGKLMQCAFSIGLSLLIFYPQYTPGAVIVTILAFFLEKIKNTSGKKQKAIV